MIKAVWGLGLVELFQEKSLTVFGSLVLGRYQAEYSTGIPLDWNLGRRNTWHAGHSACQGISRFYSASENLWIQNTKVVNTAY